MLSGRILKITSLCESNSVLAFFFRGVQSVKSFLVFDGTNIFIFLVIQKNIITGFNTVLPLKNLFIFRKKRLILLSIK